MSEANDNTLYSQGYVDALEAGIENAINERDEALDWIEKIHSALDNRTGGDNIAGQDMIIYLGCDSILRKHNRLPAGGAE